MEINVTEYDKSIKPRVGYVTSTQHTPQNSESQLDVETVDTIMENVWKRSAISSTVGQMRIDNSQTSSSSSTDNTSTVPMSKPSQTYSQAVEVRDSEAEFGTLLTATPTVDIQSSDDESESNFEKLR